MKEITAAKIIKKQTRSLNLSLGNLTILSFGAYFITLFIFVDSVKYNFLSEIAFMLFVGLSIISIFRDYKIFIHSYIKYMSVFIIYAGISSLWAIEAIYSINRIKTLLLIFIMCILIYQVFYKTKKFEYLLKIFNVTGLLFFCFALYTYGFSGIINSLLGGIRLGKEISQENVFGMYAATLGIIYLYMIVYENRYKYLALFTMMIILVTASGSRKAFLAILIGFIIILLLKYGISKLYKTFIYIIFGGAISYVILQMPMFNLVMQRISELYDVLSGGQSDYSAVLRKEFIVSGIQWFYKRPIHGYGIDNYQILAAHYLGTPSYAHNNYIEMLVNGGLIGFITYYIMYYKILIKLIKRVHLKDRINNLLVLVLLILLFYDTASVSYLTKINYIFLTIGFAYVQNINVHKNKGILNKNNVGVISDEN